MSKNLLYVLICVFALSFVIKAQEPLNVEEILPSKTLLFAGMDGKKYFEEMKTTGLYQLFTSKEWEPLVQSLTSQSVDEVNQTKAMLEKELEISLEALGQFFTCAGQMGFALVDVMLVGERPQPIPIVLMFWDLGEKKAEFAQFFDKARSKIYAKLAKNENGLKIEETSYQVGTYNVTIINTPMPIFFTYLGNMLLISSDKNYLESILADPAKKSQDSLANSEKFVAVKKNLFREKSGKLLYLNLKDIKDLVLKVAGEKANQLQPMIQQWGLDRLEAMGFGVSFRNKQVVESFYLYTPQGRTGVVAQLLPTCEAEQKLIQFMPDNVFGFSHGFMDIPGLYDTTLQLVQAFMSPRDLREIEEIRKEAETNLGLTLKDILSCFGNEYLFTISCSGGLIPDVALQISLKETAKFQEIFQKMVSMIPEKYRYQVAWNNHNFTYFNFSSKREPIPVAPAIAIENDRVLFGLYPETVKTLLEKKNGQFPADFAACMDPAIKYIYHEYWNLKAVALPLYKTMIPLIQSMLPREKLTAEPALMPGSEIFEKYFTNLFFLAVHNEKGVLWETYSPTGTIPMLVMAGGIVYGIDKNMKHHRRPPRKWNQD